jgi:hypothetical protein
MTDHHLIGTDMVPSSQQYREQLEIPSTGSRTPHGPPPALPIVPVHVTFGPIHWQRLGAATWAVHSASLAAAWRRLRTHPCPCTLAPSPRIGTCTGLDCVHYLELEHSNVWRCFTRRSTRWPASNSTEAVDDRRHGSTLLSPAVHLRRPGNSVHCGPLAQHCCVPTSPTTQSPCLQS